MADQNEPKQPTGEQNEGEGSRTADRHYRQGVQETLRKSDVEEAARRAEAEVEADPAPYRRAEEEGRSHSAGEAPGDVER